MISASQVKFGLEELAGIAPGVKGKGQYNENCMIEKLMDAYEHIKDDYNNKSFGGVYIDREKVSETETKLNSYLTDNKIDYLEQDISDLVDYLSIQELDGCESQRAGTYVGSLISIITEKNEKLGKRTIIDIPENRLAYLGYYCKKFDVVKIGDSYGSYAFALSEKGN